MKTTKVYNWYMRRIKLPPLKNSVDHLMIILVFLLLIGYASGMYFSGKINSLNRFDSLLVMDTAQVARNTLDGNLFETKYILPVSYAYFPTLQHHPDFIRYPFEILTYALLFLIFSPGAVAIKIFNGFLFILNGILTYKIVNQMLSKEDPEDIQSNGNLSRYVPLLAALASSFLVFDYFLMVLSDKYEVITYSLQLIIIHYLTSENPRPFLLGTLCGLLYLSHPNYSILGAVVIFYYLSQNRNHRDWFKQALYCGGGLLIVIFPFVIRSYIISGEPLFALQHHIDNIKGVVQSHNELYKTFNKPPDVSRVIFDNKYLYINRWTTRVLQALKNIYSPRNIGLLIGLPLFYKYFNRSRRLLKSYFIFIILHLLIVANYLAEFDTGRIYASIVTFLFVFGFSGIFKWVVSSLRRISNTKLAIFFLYTVIVMLAITPTITLPFLGGEPGMNVDYIPEEVIRSIKIINPQCVYAESAFEVAWYLNLPTIYKPAKNEEMLKRGPKGCHYFMSLGEINKSTVLFLKQNALLLYNNGKYSFYEINN